MRNITDILVMHYNFLLVRRVEKIPSSYYWNRWSGPSPWERPSQCAQELQGAYEHSEVPYPW